MWPLAWLLGKIQEYSSYFILRGRDRRCKDVATACEISQAALMLPHIKLFISIKQHKLTFFRFGPSEIMIFRGFQCFFLFRKM